MLITYYGVVSSIFSEGRNDISEFFHFLDFCDMVQMKEIFNVTPALISDMPVTRNFASRSQNLQTALKMVFTESQFSNSSHFL